MYLTWIMLFWTCYYNDFQINCIVSDFGLKVLMRFSSGFMIAQLIEDIIIAPAFYYSYESTAYLISSIKYFVP